MASNQSFLDYMNKENAAVCKEFGTDPVKGLSQNEISTRHKKYGFNAVKDRSMQTALSIFMRQFRSPFMYLLMGSAGVLFMLESHFDAAVILCIIAVNGLIGFYQEYRSEQIVQLLKKYLVSHSIVMRDGKRTDIESSDLVPGDLVVLEAGTIIPADMRLIKADNLMIDESILTGESAPVPKQTDAVQKEEKTLFNAHNIGFYGTKVIGGTAIGLVFETGQNTIVGQLTEATQNQVPASDFTAKIGAIGRFVIYFVAVSICLVLLLNWIVRGNNIDWVQFLVFVAALGVTVVPEGLPIVITFALSRGSLILSRKKVIVKRLSAIEALGEIQILCTDKTGTITENELAVVDSYPKDERTPLILGKLLGVLSHEKTSSMGGFDLALYNVLSPDEQKKVSEYEKVAEVPFDPDRRLSGGIVKHGSESQGIILGALESILEECSSLKAADQKSVEEWAATQGLNGNRVLAVAQKKVASSGAKEAFDTRHGGFEFSGLIAFKDPLKKTAHESIVRAKKLGVIVKIISGDAMEVCGSVAHQVGLIDDSKKVIVGVDFARMDEHEKRKIVNEYHVFARIAPQQKQEIVTLLLDQGGVGYIGDGINDVPALRAANVGISVHNAVDVVREEADIILLHSSLRVVIDAIQEGRSIYGNIVKYLRVVLSSNFGNFYSLSLASLLFDYLPMLPIQLLLVNLLADVPMLTIATDHVNPEELSKPVSLNLQKLFTMGLTLGIVSTMFDFVFFMIFSRISPAVLQTGWFVESVLTALVFIFSMRTMQFFARAGLPSWPLVVSALGIAAITIALPFTEFGARFFSMAHLKPIYIVWIGCIALSYFCATELIKIVFNKVWKKIGS